MNARIETFKKREIAGCGLYSCLVYMNRIGESGIFWNSPTMNLVNG